jgi:hypothetical protein
MIVDRIHVGLIREQSLALAENLLVEEFLYYCSDS